MQMGSRIFLDICAGADYSLTSGILNRGCKCFREDKLIDAKMDLLDNNFFALLRICASDLLGYGAAAPNCGEYTCLKLQPGGPQRCAHYNFWTATKLMPW